MSDITWKQGDLTWKEEVAFAILLLKDFKSEGKFDPEATLAAIGLAKRLGVSKEFDEMLSKVPPMRVEPRYKP